jgi:hypothetical protein
MPCPIVLGFFHSLENNDEDKVRNTSFEFLVSSKDTFPALRMEANLELEQPPGVYQVRAQYAIQVVVSAMYSRSPPLIAPILGKPPVGMLQSVNEMSEELDGLLLISKMKRKSNGANTHRLADRLVIKGGLRGLQKQLKSFTEGDYKGVGYGLGDGFRGLHMPNTQALVIARKMLTINDPACP